MDNWNKWSLCCYLRYGSIYNWWNNAGIDSQARSFFMLQLSQQWPIRLVTDLRKSRDHSVCAQLTLTRNISLAARIYRMIPEIRTEFGNIVKWTNQYLPHKSNGCFSKIRIMGFYNIRKTSPWKHNWCIDIGTNGRTHTDSINVFGHVMQLAEWYEFAKTFVTCDKCSHNDILWISRHHMIWPKPNLTHLLWGKTLSWWRYQMEAFSVLLALCEGRPPVTGGFPPQRQVTRMFSLIFPWTHGWANNRDASDLWRHCNAVLSLW